MKIFKPYIAGRSVAKDSICKAYNTKGHWAKSVMCLNNSKAGAKQPTENRKSDAQVTQSNSTGNPYVQFISADGKSQISQSASAKTINLSAILYSALCYS